jgi:hypothetical protein
MILLNNISQIFILILDKFRLEIIKSILNSFYWWLILSFITSLWPFRPNTHLITATTIVKLRHNLIKKVLLRIFYCLRYKSHLCFVRTMLWRSISCIWVFSYVILSCVYSHFIIYFSEKYLFLTLNWGSSRRQLLYIIILNCTARC